MTGLDTNILVRFFTHDEPAQRAKVLKLMRSLTVDEPGWVSLAVVLELAWVLRSGYRVDREQLVAVFQILLSRREIVLEQPTAVRNAIDIYSKTNVDFADSLISASAHLAGCSKIVTFDMAAAKTAGMTLLA